MDMHRKSIETAKAGLGVVERGAKETQCAPIFKAVETSYLHCESNGFG
jgi:hypothetical protein